MVDLLIVTALESHRPFILRFSLSALLRRLRFTPGLEVLMLGGHYPRFIIHSIPKQKNGFFYPALLDSILEYFT